jgi:hypothetical protein
MASKGMLGIGFDTWPKVGRRTGALHLTRRHYGFSGFNSPAAAAGGGVVRPQTENKGRDGPKSLLSNVVFAPPDRFWGPARGRHPGSRGM